jgi:hypothetical protein
MAKIDHSDRYDAGLSRAFAETHELIRRALKTLSDPAPDTFLGRKTQEPFPTENDSEIARRLKPS